ncbi:MAG: hypothetical protein A2096_07225 [Spirochaetes bacterium GWF1_41_5]|nr:MAG: hypothetical protein A2096_07225 [Spirochaetes bacterium GWF1_41_5]HBE00944.1 D-glycero-beta-D-manno-heptose-7-phosphate kinase [Spirochaetia bacterium]
MIQKKLLLKAIKSFPRGKILIVGDLIYDRYLCGQAERISPEAPVPVVLINREESRPGGACNVAWNITALGASAALCGITGSDHNGREMTGLLEKSGIETRGIFSDPTRPTSVKTRVIAQAQQMLRIDHEKTHPVSPSLLRKMYTFIKNHISGYSGMVISDYGKGVINREFTSDIIKIGKKYNKIITVDPVIQNYHFYSNVFSMTPNHKEASGGTGLPCESDEETIICGNASMQKLNLETLLITRGSRGMTLFTKKQKPVFIPTCARTVFDVSGAGDTVISIFTLAAALGVNPLQAAILSNIGAGVVVSKFGTASVTRRELTEAVKSYTLDIYSC